MIAALLGYAAIGCCVAVVCGDGAREAGGSSRASIALGLMFGLVWPITIVLALTTSRSDAGR